MTKPILVLAVAAMMATPAMSHEREAKAMHAQLKTVHTDLHPVLKFKTAAELKASRLGTPLHVYMVGLAGLKGFQQNGDPRRLLIDTREVIYPLHDAQGKFRSAMSFRRKGNKWEHSSFGGGEIHVLQPAREKHAAAARKMHSDYFVVKVPGMYLMYLGYIQNNKLFLVPSHTHDKVKNFQLNQAVPADRVFNTLKPLAPQYERALRPPAPPIITR